MKKWLCVLLCACACTSYGKVLPLGEAARAEEALYMDFLQGLLAGEVEETSACPYYASALQRAPQNKLLLRLMTICALSAQDLQAAEQYVSFMDAGEHDGADWAVYAFYQWRRGDLPAAQQAYEKALELAPEDSRILYQYTLLLSTLDVDRAAGRLQAHKELHPDMAAVLDYETGNLYRAKKQFAKALDYYQAATQANAAYAEPYLARAEIYEKTSQYFLMLRELEALEQTGYESAAVFSRMGAVYALVNDTGRARAYFLKAKAQDKGDVPSGYFLALYEEQQGNFAAAAQYVQETADFDTEASKWLQVSFYQQRAGEDAAALKTLQQAYERFADNVEIGYFYGLLLLDEQQYRRAARVLKGVLATNPQYEAARLAYAFALEGQGKYAAMEAQVRQLLAQNAEHAAAYNLLGFSLADRNIRLDEAQELITRALALKPQDRAFADSLAWVYYRRGDYIAALELLQSLGEDFVRENADISYHLGAVYAALGRREEAQTYLRLAAPSNREAARLLKRL